jgi:NADPH-dependent 2,4-dienoyl-CoA reductase/sulfur reductase-like enzyme
MKEKNVDVAVIGGGPAGLAAALAAKKKGAEVLIIERNEGLGGILNQCIHEGFGIELFKEAFSGPEYMQKFIDRVKAEKIPYILNATVLSIDDERKLLVCSPAGLMMVSAKSVVLAMGCRERTRGNISIPGDRPAGVYTAGCAKNLINLRNYMVGRRVVILGSGDIGLIMARRMTLEGAKVLAVVELLPYSSGLPRNIAQCLDDYDIPLYLSHTVTKVAGGGRVESITIAEVDEYMKPISGTEKHMECDTLLLSVGLIPENELSKQAGVEIQQVTSGPVVDENLQTSAEGIFACGNVLHVHDIVDWVTLEGELAGSSASDYAKGINFLENKLSVSAGEGVRYVLPQKISGKRDVKISLRVFAPSRNRKIVVRAGDRILKKTHRVRLMPSEMIRVSLKKEDLKDVGQLTVEVSE